jgi:hypothetical protein
MSEMENDLSVLIYHNDIPVVRCKPKYVGLLGMFLCAGPVKFHSNTRLDVELIFGEDEGRRLRLPAIVMISNRRGLGLTFLSPDHDSINGLREILNDLPVQSVGLAAV